MRFSLKMFVWLVSLFALTALVGCSGPTETEKKPPEKIGVTNQALAPTFFDTFDDTGRINNDGFQDLGGGVGWTTSWSIDSGLVRVSNDMSFSGTFSAKFGETEDDIMHRDMTYVDDSMFTVYVNAPSTTDALAIIEVRSDGSSHFMARFNYGTAGQMQVYDGAYDVWSDVGAFVPDDWNKVGLVMNINSNTMDAYLNDALVATDVHGLYGGEVTRLYLEGACANDNHVYFDSINCDPPPITLSFAVEDFDGAGYANSGDLQDLHGGMSWTSAWSIDGGDVTLSDDTAFSGTLSAKFGATEDDIMHRDMTMEDGDELDIYVNAPSSTDALAIMEVRCGGSNNFMARFNYGTAGQMQTYDGVSTMWSNIGAFVPDEWNKVGLVMNSASDLMDVYLNDSLLASGVYGMGCSGLSRLYLEGACANDNHVYFDSISQHRAPYVVDNFDSYSNSDSMSGKNGGTGWNSAWTVSGGAVTLSNDISFNGTLSAKFGATSDDYMYRNFTYIDGDFLEVYVNVPSSTDALAIFEARSGEASNFMARFNYGTAGQVQTYDGVSTTWSNIGAFVPDEWNKMTLVMDTSNNLMDVYLNDNLLVTGVHGMNNGSITRLILEGATANSHHVYFDGLSATHH